jgi:hypothetical protein
MDGLRPALNSSIVDRHEHAGHAFVTQALEEHRFMTPIDRTFGRRGPLGGIVLAAVALAAVEGGAQESRGAEPPRTPAASASAPSPAPSRADPSGEIHWPVPAGWNHETIPFPLGFAPQLPYRGVEELRFAPGWSKPNQPGYWSCDIVWWLTEKPAFDAATMEAALATYFHGLSESVGRGKLRVDASRFRAELVADRASRQLTGRIFSMDAFATGLPITLNAVIELRECGKARRHAVILMLSPRGSTDPIWRALQSTARALVCE